MAERNLAQNVAQAIADFKAIKDIVNESSGVVVHIPDGTPTSQYAEKIDDAFLSVYQTGNTDGLNEGRQIGYGEGYQTGYEEGYTAGTEEGGNNEEIYQEGFEAGYKDGVGAAEATVSGETIRVDDVVDIEHPLNITVQSKNLFDVNKINTESATINNDGTFSVIGHPSGIGVLGAMCPLLKEGDTIVVNWDGTTNDALYLYELKSYISKNTPTVITNEMLNSRVGIYANRVDGILVNTVVSNFQIELGETATAYAPYISDFSGVKVSRYGKNLIPPPSDKHPYYRGTVSSGYPYMPNQSFPITTTTDIDVSNYRGVYKVMKLKEGETYTLSIKNIVMNCATPQYKLAVGFRSSETTIIGNSEVTHFAQHDGYNSPSLTFTVPIGYPYCFIGVYIYPTVAGDTMSFEALQLEIGSNATEYEEYNEPQVVTSNADGIAEELSNIAPTMTFLTNTDGVRLNCSYLKSAVIENQLEAFKEGQKSEYDRFWDAYQECGKRTNYTCAFGSMWTAETFKPKYSIRPTNAYMMFFTNSGHKIQIDDFVEFCEQNNIELDLSNCTNTMYGLGCLHTKRFGVLDVRKSTNTNYMFYSNTALITIDEWISSENTAYVTGTFDGATNLTNLKMSGVVSANIGFNKNTKLTKASIESIVGCLSDTTSALTATFSKTAVNNAFTTDEWAALISTKPNWTISLV